MLLTKKNWVGGLTSIDISSIIEIQIVFSFNPRKTIESQKKNTNLNPLKDTKKAKRVRKKET